MKFLDYIRLAMKNLTRRKSRTFLTVLAITVGSFSLILMVSLVSSIRQSMMDAFDKMGATNLVTVTRDPNSANDVRGIFSTNGNNDQSEGKKLDDTAVTAVKGLPNITSVTPIVGGGMAKTMHLEGQSKKSWVSLIGYEPSSNIFSLPISYGRGLTDSDMDKIVVGSGFVQTYDHGASPQALIGKKVIITYGGGPNNGPDWGSPPAQPPANADKSWYDSQKNAGIDIPAEIVGVADNSILDSEQNYINIAWARRLNVNVSWQYQDQKNNKEGSNQQPQMVLVKDDQLAANGYSTIIAKVDDTKNLKSVSGAIASLGYGVSTAQKMIDDVNKALLAAAIISGCITGIAMFVAAIGIINTMMMATYERTKEIGVMRACGATRKVIRRLFTFEAALLGLLGGTVGLAISFAIARLARFALEKNSGNIGIPVKDIGNFPLWLIIGALSFTTIVGILAGLYPAAKASRLDPTEALRYE